jgi:hypothetical protein
MGNILSGVNAAIVGTETLDDYQFQTNNWSIPWKSEYSNPNTDDCSISPTTILNNCSITSSSDCGSNSSNSNNLLSTESSSFALPAQSSPKPGLIDMQGELGTRFGFTIGPPPGHIYILTNNGPVLNPPSNNRLLTLDRNALYYKRMRQWITQHKSEQVSPFSFVVPVDDLEDFIANVQSLVVGGHLRYLPVDVRAKIIEYFQNEGGNVAKLYTDTTHAVMYYGVGPYKRKEGHSILFLFESYDLIEAKETLKEFNQRGFKLFIEKTGPDAAEFRSRFDVT